MIPQCLAIAVAIPALADGPVASSDDLLAPADFMTWNITLSGCAEVPPVSTLGTGTASITLDTQNNTVTVEGSYENMSSPVTAAHIHGPAAQGQNAGVILALQTNGGTSGSITGNGTLTPAEATDMINGLTYINVHSEAHPGGEIRGQILYRCVGDFNDDGVKNILDFVAFQNAFVQGDCAADVNNDLEHDILDFVAFQSLFLETCN